MKKHTQKPAKFLFITIILLFFYTINSFGYLTIDNSTNQIDPFHNKSTTCALPETPFDPFPENQSHDIVVNTKLMWNGFHDIINNMDDFTRDHTKIIYGDDNRLDEYQMTDPKRLAAGDATVAIVMKTKLKSNQDQTVELPSTTFGYSKNLCEDEPFYNQPVASFCTGFLVSSNIVATAGHCITEENDYYSSAEKCSEVAFIFGFVMKNATTPNLIIDKSQVYYCQEVIARQLDNGDADYSLIRLDRNVTDHIPVSIRRSNKASLNDNLLVIGHPVGLPRKYADGAQIMSNVNSVFFDANLDTYSGNSGSPVFNADTLVVEGILVEGGTDFVTDRVHRCERSNECPDSGCDGFEKAVRTTEFSDYIPSYDVYLGNASNQMSLICSDVSMSMCDPGTLIGTTYYWQVIAKNQCGSTKGPIWTFEGPEGDHGVTFSIEPNNSGAMTPSAGLHLYDDGETISLTAIPIEGYRFDHWEGPVDDHYASHTQLIVKNSEMIVSVFAPLPIARQDQIITALNTSAQIDVISNDDNPNNGNLIVSKISTPLHGSAETNGQMVTYKPTNGFIGNDEITYTLSDQTGGEDHAIIQIMVNSDFSIQFDGKDDYIDCGTSLSLNITDAFTIEAWIFPMGFGEYADVGFGRIMDKDYIVFFINNDNHENYKDHSLVAYLEFQNSQVAIFSTQENSISLNEWQHVAVTYDGLSNVIIYINGQKMVLNHLYNEPSGSIHDNQTIPLYIGESQKMDRAFEGKIDEFRLWDTVRLPSQINETMHHRLIGNEDHLILYFPFIRIENPLIDISCNGHNSPFYGAQWGSGVPSMSPAINSGLVKVMLILQHLNNSILVPHCSPLDINGNGTVHLENAILELITMDE